jgi:CRISPR-associated endonuclease/helicase Cas3
VYDTFLLEATSARLQHLPERPVVIPGDVQTLVESVHGTGAQDFDWDNPGAPRRQSYNAHQGTELAHRGQAGLIAVYRARQVARLHDLHRLPGEEDEWEVATRLGAASVRLLCAYVHGNGVRSLDPAGAVALPEPGEGAGLSADAVRTVMRRTVPVNSDWFTGADPDAVSPPSSWADHPLLGDLRVLYQPVHGATVGAVTVAGSSLRLDEDCGLERR